VSNSFQPISRASFWTIAIPFFLLVAGAVQAADKTDASESVAAKADGMPLTDIINAVAKRTQKRYLVDPRVRANVSPDGLDINKISYRELQAILRLHGFVAVEIGGAINVVPDANLRFMPMPVLDKDSANLGDDDVVIKVLSAGKLDATGLVPLLRPMLPQYAHLAATPDNNALVVAATYANVKTIEAVVRALEKLPVSKPLTLMSTEPSK
jgi:general secretion pathway protein D